MRKLVAWDNWDKILELIIRASAVKTARLAGDTDVKDTPKELEEAVIRTLKSYWESLSEEERKNVIYYLIVGSQNQDYRGMIMDGEAASVITRAYSLVGLVDFFFLSSQTTWIIDEKDLEKFNQLLPTQSGWRRWFGRFITKAL